MLKPIECFIGFRYARAKRRGHFISFISFISMLGIALGMVVLITVLSVLNGFDKEIKKSVFSMISPITISDFSGHIENWQTLETSIKKISPVTAIAPLIYGQALLQNGDDTQPTMLVGVFPEEEKQVSGLDEKITEGNKLSHLTPGGFHIILGEELAQQLHVSVGDKLIIVTQKNSTHFASITPRYHTAIVTGIFRASGGGFDARLAYIHLKDAQTIFNYGTTVSALHANVKDIYSAPLITKQLEKQLSPRLHVTNWTTQLGDFFNNIRLTKTMMFFIFILIIIVAVFNLICTLVMVVKNKQADIAILRTMGATPKMIMGIFVIQGAIIAVGGILLGILGGVLLAQHVTDVVNAIQNTFHIKLITSKVYFVDYLPSELQWADVWKISFLALILSLLATLYPAWNASRMQPVEGLRYE